MVKLLGLELELELATVDLALPRAARDAALLVSVEHRQALEWLAETIAESAFAERAESVVSMDLGAASMLLVALRAASDTGQAAPVLVEFKLDLVKAFYAAQLELMKAHQRTP